MASQWERVKWLPSPRDARLLVDGFGYASPACKHYVLTHCHSDHTVGLTRRFSHGTIYATEVTARLLVHDMGLPQSVVQPLALHTPYEVAGCRVTLLDANHCPGAAMVLVEVVADGSGNRLQPPYTTILHTGDCRWEGWMGGQVPRGVRVGTLLLDTTYANARYTFPPQAAVVDAVAEWARAALAAEPSTLLVVGAYHIGKVQGLHLMHPQERLFLGLARKLGLRVWCAPAKRRVLALLGLSPHELALLADDPREAQVHVVGMGLQPAALEALYLDTTGSGSPQKGAPSSSQAGASPGALLGAGGRGEGEQCVGVRGADGWGVGAGAAAGAAVARRRVPKDVDMPEAVPRPESGGGARGGCA